jgi:hypothetical protein
MTDLETASEIIIEIINKYRNELDKKYSNVEYPELNNNGVFLTCFIQKREKRTLRVIADYPRRRFTPPMNAEDRLEGHAETSKRMQQTNPDAWKIEATQTTNNQTYEIGFAGNESNWNVNDFESNFVSIFVQP